MTALDPASSPVGIGAPNGSINGSIGPGYILSVLCGGVTALAVFSGMLLFLDRTGHLPPPPIANNICIDEKLAFMRQHPPQDPNLLVVGSSVAWRHFDGAVITAMAPGSRPLNGAFCSLHANQAVFVANWLLDRLPSVREVVMIASLHDFEACSMHPAAVFDKGAVDNYVFGHAWRWSFYFQFFDPVSLLRNTRQIAAMRNHADPLHGLVFTRFGDGPLDTTASAPTLEYGEVRGFDPACFAALRSLAERLASENRRLVVVATPLHPEWKRLHDSNANVRVRFERGALASLEGTGGEYWDGDVAAPMKSQAFLDAIHLRWSAVRRFSETMVRALWLASATRLVPDEAFEPERYEMNEIERAAPPPPRGLGKRLN